MSRSSTPTREKARKSEALIRNAINDAGRKAVMQALNVSDGTCSKFIAGNADDCKINIVSLSDLLVGLGLKVVPLGAEICPDGHIPVPMHIAVAAWHNSELVRLKFRPI